MAFFHFIPPPSLLDQHQITAQQIHHPGIALQNHQHVTVHQVHNPGAIIHHPAPFLPVAPMMHDPFLPIAPMLHDPFPVMYPQMHAPLMPAFHPGAIAMQHFAPGTLQQNLARQPRRLAHITTYSTARLAAGDATAHALYDQALLATGLQPLITFDVSHFPAAPAALAMRVSGVSGEMQELVRGYGEGMRDLWVPPFFPVPGLSADGGAGMRLCG
ncbi:hypothetical protein PMIN06_005435 [Paraphaeosphaeria minitans]